MSKSTHKRRHFIGGFLTISESMVMAENMEAGRYGWPWSSRRELKISDPKDGDRERDWARHGLLKSQSNKVTLPNPSHGAYQLGTNYSNI